MSDENERTIFVGNLASKITEDLLEELFVQVGPVEKVILRSSPTNTFALIQFHDEDTVPFAIEVMDGVQLFGTAIHVKPRNGTLQEEAFKKKMANRRPVDRQLAQSYTPSHMDDRKRDHMGFKNVREDNWRQARPSATPEYMRSPSQPLMLDLMSGFVGGLPPPPPAPSMGYRTPSRPQPGFKVPSSHGRDNWHIPPPPDQNGRAGGPSGDYARGYSSAGREARPSGRREEPRRSFPSKERDQPQYDRRDSSNGRDYRRDDRRDGSRDSRGSGGGGGGGDYRGTGSRSGSRDSRGDGAGRQWNQQRTFHGSY